MDAGEDRSASGRVLAGRHVIEGDESMSAGRVLVVDDDPQIRRVMRVTLSGQGYEIDDAKSGDGALEALRERRFDLVLLDMNMPGMSGLEACRMIRRQSEVAVIMLTVRDNESDKVDALDAGADDYVTKPFKSQSCWPAFGPCCGACPARSAGWRSATVEVDFDARQVIGRNQRMRLTPREFELLRYLAAHPNKVLSHRELLQAVWGPDYGDEVDALRVVVNQLRKKIEVQPSKPVCLLTEPWVGYRLNLPPEYSAGTLVKWAP